MRRIIIFGLQKIRSAWLVAIWPVLLKLFKKLGRIAKKVSAKAWHHTKRTSKAVHGATAVKLHNNLRGRWKWYEKWHAWEHHQRVHLAIAGAYILFIGIWVFGVYQKTFALPDLTNTWDFSVPGDYTASSGGAEVTSGKARLKAQEYSTDANTTALYHLNESSGTSAADSSGNSNTGTTRNSPSWVSGRYNNGTSLNGTSQSLDAADSASLDLTQKNTLEATFKLNSTFSAESNASDMSLIDKGAYKLVLDKTTGKLTYSLNSSSHSWTDKYGGGLPTATTGNGTPNQITATTSSGTDVYTAVTNYWNVNEVWKLSGGSWTKLGTTAGLQAGFGFAVKALWVDGTTLYALSPYYQSGFYYWYEWSCDISAGCGSWTQRANLSVNTSLPAMGGTVYQNNNVAVIGSNFYIAGPTGIVYNCTAGSCSNFTVAAGYDYINAIVTDGTYLYTAMGSSGSDGDVYRCTTAGSCTKIGGDGLIYNATGWANSTYETVNTMTIMGGNLYVGLGSGANDDELWYATGITGTPTWTKIAGDGTGWTGTGYVSSIVNDGTNLYVQTAASSKTYKYSGSWSTLVNTAYSTPSLYYGNSTLYSGYTDTGNNTELVSVNTSSGATTILGGHKINSSWQGAGYVGTPYITEYNGVLYAAVAGTAASDGKDYESGVFKIENCSSSCTWTKVGGYSVASSFGAVSSFYRIFVYNNKVCSIMEISSNREIWCYNGSSWNQLATHTDLGSSTSPTDYQVVTYQGNLYVDGVVSSGSSIIKTYNGSTWSTAFTPEATDMRSTMTVMNGKIYVIAGRSNNNGGYYTYDGSTWSSKTLMAVFPTGNFAYWSIVAGDKIYFPCSTNVSSICSLASDGTAATVIASTGISCVLVGDNVAYFGDSIYYSCPGGGFGAYVDKILSFNPLSGSPTVTDVTGTWGGTTDQRQSALYANSHTLWAGEYTSTPNTSAGLWSQSNTKAQSTTSSWTSGTWYHVAATYDGENMKIYVNGTLQTTVGVAMTLPTNTQKLYIGRAFSGGDSKTNESLLAGTIDEVRVSNAARTSFNTIPYSSTDETVTLNTPVRPSGVWHWDTWADSETPNGGTIKYRLSSDGGTTWLYWNGSSWASSSGTGQANDVATINTNMATFPVTFSGLKWQAVLTGDGTQQVTLNSITAQATSDITAPGTNASAITAQKSNGGATLNSGGWTNGGSPYFSWTAGSDAASGVKGYCLYLGTDNTADPVTTKGLLGTSPVSTGGNCQFMVSSTNIDLATAGYLGTALTTSNSSYYLSIKAMDNAGNVIGTSAQFNFKFDNTAPSNPAYISAPSGFVASKAVTMTWPTASGAASDANSGVVGLQYKINSTSWYGDSHTGTGDINDLLTNDGSYTTIDPTDFNNINEGINTVYFRTWDQAGNVTTSYVTAAIKINTTGAPSEPQTLAATPTTNTVNSFAFSWAAPATYNGNASNIVYCYTVNTLPSSGSCIWTQPGVTSLAAGAYATQPTNNTFYVVAKDESGAINYSTYSSVNFTANTTAPGIPINTAITDVSIRSTSNWRLAVTWETPTSVGSGVASYKVYRSTDGSSYSQVGSSSSTSYVDTGLSQQKYYYQVKACDSTNNCGAFGTVVNDTPTGKFTSAATLTAQPSVSGVTTHKATVSWSTDRESDSRIAYGTSSGNYAKSEIAVSAQTTAHNIELDNLGAGTTYYAVAKWTDVDGNTGTSQEFTFTTDAAPSLKEITTATIGLNSATIKFTSRSATKISVYYGKTDSFGAVTTINTSAAESTYSVNLTGLDDGTKYFYKLVAYDSENFAYQGSVFAFTTPARPHISNLRFQPVTGEPTSTQKITWQTNVPSTTSITYGPVGTEGTGAALPQLVTEHEITVKNLKDNTEYFVVAQSQDASGNIATSDKQIFKTDLDTRPPKISEVNIETSVRGTGADARSQVIVSWHTDEPATSQVGYADGSKATVFNNKTAEDGAMSTEHIVIVSGLPTSRVYTVVPISKDKAANQSVGEPQTAIIERASDSVLTIVLDTLRKVFGF